MYGALTEKLNNFTNGRGAVTLGLAAGAAFVTYCIYFDQKRRSAPDFKKKLKESMFDLHFCTLSPRHVAPPREAKKRGES